MGCAPTVRYCDACGGPGAGVQLADDAGRVRPEFYCWDCAMGQATPVPTPLRAVLALLDPAWVRTRAGAIWLARRLAAREARQEGRPDG